MKMFASLNILLISFALTNALDVASFGNQIANQINSNLQTAFAKSPLSIQRLAQSQVADDNHGSTVEMSQRNAGTTLVTIKSGSTKHNVTSSYKLGETNFLFIMNKKRLTDEQVKQTRQVHDALESQFTKELNKTGETFVLVNDAKHQGIRIFHNSTEDEVNVYQFVTVGATSKVNS